MEKEENEKENILRILKEAESAVEREDNLRLKELSNQTIHNASMFQDPDSITVAVLIYSLSKVIERKRYTYYEEWPVFYKNYMKNIEKAIKALENDDIESFRKALRSIREQLNLLSDRFKNYIQDVFRKAEINKASKIYDHGISMEKTAKTLGITIWELAEYSGQAGVADMNLTMTLPIKKRLRYTEDIFK